MDNKQKIPLFLIFNLKKLVYKIIRGEWDLIDELVDNIEKVETIVKIKEAKDSDLDHLPEEQIHLIEEAYSLIKYFNCYQERNKHIAMFRECMSSLKHITKHYDDIVRIENFCKQNNYIRMLPEEREVLDKAMEIMIIINKLTRG